MKNDTLNITRLEGLLAAGRVREAFGLLDNAVAAAPHLRNFSADIDALREDYGRMAEYALRGLPDPGREEAYTDITARMRRLADLMLRQILTADSPTLYYNTLRYELTEPGSTPARLLEEYRRINNRLSMAALTENPGDALRSLTLTAEQLERRFFNRLWILAPFSTSESALVKEILADPSLPRHFKLLGLSAVTMGLMEWYDEGRLMLLMDAYADAADGETAVRALTGLLLGLWMHRSRPMSRRLRVRFESLTELPGWAKDVKLINMQFLRARDTERITRKFTEEVIPEMMKLRPEIEKLGQRPLSPEAIEENPEWAEMLEKSGVADRLKELQEMQEDGGDVMMATFSRLKTFPFFNDISNWFLPYHAGHSLTFTSGDDSGSLGDLVEGLTFMCSSDKYSMLLSFGTLPEQQRRMMAGQMQAQAEQLQQIRHASLDPTAREMDEIAAGYVHDLYRFYKLFRRKGEFADPFRLGLNIPALPEFEGLFNDADTLSLIGEFYFKRKYYADAFDTFVRLSLLVPPSAALFQKMGYCKQMLGETAEAIRYYDQSELLTSESLWTMRRLAACHRHLGHWEEALGYYRRLAERKPDDVQLALNIGLALMKLRRFDEALTYLFKAEFLGNSSEKAIRAIAWCTLLDGDFERARKYTDIVMSYTDLTPVDYLNAGHLSLLTGSPAEAARLYSLSIAARDFDIISFLADFERDRATLGAFAAIDPALVRIVIDEAIHQSESQGKRI